MRFKLVILTGYWLIFVFLCVQGIGATVKADCRILVIMSYEDTYPWEQDIRSGIEQRVGGDCSLFYFYLKTKEYPENGPAMAAQAYAFYRELNPDGVLAVDDNAQSMFVLPYLKGKVSIPVIFCGVNASPDEYGYPAENVSGVLERPHTVATIAFAKQLVPDLQTFAFLGRDNETSLGILKQIQAQTDSLPLSLVAVRLPKNMSEALTMTKELKSLSDALYLVNLRGLTGETGIPLAKEEIIPEVLETYGKPSMTDIGRDIRLGVMCALAASGEEQGVMAADMLLKAMSGTPMQKLPVIQTKKGKAMVNITVLKQLKLQPLPHLLKGAELVETVK